MVIAVDTLNPLPYASGVLVLAVLTTRPAGDRPLLALVALAVFPSSSSSRALNGRAEHLFAEAQGRAGAVSAVADETFDGAAVVRSLGAEEREVARFAVEAEACATPGPRPPAPAPATTPCSTACPASGWWPWWASGRGAWRATT